MMFILGLFMASFLNVIAERTVRCEKWFCGRSYCPSCKHTLAWYDLIPVLSYLLLGGKCRYCKERIPIRYPLSEIVLGIAFYMASRYTHGVYTAFVLFGISVAYISALTDIYDGTIYDAFTLPFAFLFIALRAFFSVTFLFDGLFGMMAGFLVPYVIVRATKMAGEGDVTFLTFLGAFLGLNRLIIAVPLSFVIAGIVVTVLLVMGKANMKSHVPLVPFLFAGTVWSFYL